MGELAIIFIKGLVGGLFVALFAMLGESVRPKSFAGLFSAAPSIALASLTIIILTKGSADAREQTLAMVFGAIGMVVYCVLAAFALERFSALAGSGVPFAAWFAVAGLSYALVLR